MAYAFSEQALRRITNAVKRLEEKLASTEQRPSRDKRADWMLHFVRLTDAEKVDGRYPGKWMEHDVTTDEWSEKATVWIVGPNDEELETETIYLARQTGQATATVTVDEVEVEDSRPVMAVSPSPALNATEFVQITVDNEDTTYDGVVRRWNVEEETWEEFGEVVVIEAHLGTLQLDKMYMAIRYGADVYVARRTDKVSIVRNITIDSTDDIDLLDVGDADIVRLQSDGLAETDHVLITGISDGTNGRQLTIINVADIAYVEFARSLSGGSNNNRIDLQQGYAWKLRPGFSVDAWWDESSSVQQFGAWRLSNFHMPYQVHSAGTTPFPKPPLEEWAVPRMPARDTAGEILHDATATPFQSPEQFSYLSAMEVATSTIYDDGGGAKFMGDIRFAPGIFSTALANGFPYGSAVLFIISNAGTLNGLPMRTPGNFFTWLINDQANTVVLKHLDVTNPAGTFAFKCPGNVNFSLKVGESVPIYFSGYWYVLGLHVTHL